MAKTVFISYGRDLDNPQHVELVKRVKFDLEQADFNVLMDLDRLKTGDDWELKLENDILASDWILFFITPYSARRPDGYCLNELSFALYKKKPIAPVMIDFIVPPLSICRIQYLDLQHLKDDVIYRQKIAEIISVLNEEKELGFEGEHTALLKNLDPLKFDSTIRKHIYGFVGRQWIYDKVDRWLKNNTDSRVLWITAEAGYGKSALATYLSEKHPSSTSIHFCQHDAKATRDPVNILKTVIYGLSVQIPEYHQKLQATNIKEKLQGSATDIFRELLEEPISEVGRPARDLFFIIDALDEAKDSDGKNPIVNLIANHFADLPEWLNIIVTSRPEPALMRKLKKFNPLELEAYEQDNLDDLKQFISKKLGNELDPTLIQAMVKKSEGNILYLKMMLELDSIRSGSFTIKDIEVLPEGMEGIYLQYFERKFNNIDDYEENLLAFVNIMIASKEGLSPALINYILDIKERAYNKIHEAFGSLLEENNGLLTFYHKSLFDWLSDYDKSGNFSADNDAGNELLSNRLWELYEEEDSTLPTGYETYLLQALYATKAYKKLEIALKDILLIGRMFDQKTVATYKEVLSSTIYQYAKNSDIVSLKLYESFLREKEHLISKINETHCRPHQAFFQAAYEDGDNSPLSQQADRLLKVHKIGFLWLKAKKRSPEYSRLGLLKVLEGHTSWVKGVQILADGRILSYSVDGTLRLWSSEGEALKVLEGHTSWVNGVQILADDRILSYSRDGTLRLWSSEGEALKVLEGHTGDVAGVQIMADDRILSYSHDDTLRLWSSEGEALKELKGHTGDVAGVQIMADDRILSCSGDDGTLRLWSSEGEALKVLEGYTSWVKGVQILADGQILSYSYDGTLQLWSSEGEALKELKGHTGVVNSVQILADDRILSYSVDGTLRLWSSEGEALKELKGHTGDVAGVQIMADDRILSYSRDGTLRLWSSEGEALKELKGHTGDVAGVQILADDRILSYSVDGTLRLWSSEGKALKVLEGYTSWVKGVQIMADGRILSYSGAGDDTLRLWSSEGKALKVLEGLEGHTSWVKGVQILADDRILSYSYDATLRLWSSEGEALKVLEGHTDDVKGVQILADGRILSYSYDDTLRLWSSEGEALKVLEGHTSWVNGVQILADDRILSYSGDGTLRLWSSKGEALKVLEGHTSWVNGVQILADDRILSYSHDDTLRLWSSEGEALKVLEGHTDDAKGVQIMADGRILSYSRDGTLRLWSSEGEALKELKGHTGDVAGVQILADDRILSYSHDDTLRLWSSEGEALKELKGHTGDVAGVQIMADDRILSYSGDDGTLRLWSSEGEALKVLEGHTSWVNGVQILADGRILSYSYDGTLRLWSSEGILFKMFFVPREKVAFFKIQQNKLIGADGKYLFFYDFFDGDQPTTINAVAAKYGDVLSEG